MTSAARCRGDCSSSVVFPPYYHSRFREGQCRKMEVWSPDCLGVILCIDPHPLMDLYAASTTCKTTTL